ncbi:segregation/condensation protein A [Nannocystis punicea]|uniref:Segregation and condensation protein A n=1 Tax=Nannocystis punicea TaxID=2995304 RepID=A0ABY7HHR5_9BACT|nr:segregation/condensation protein A [Nannocystis poenicansa]WAS98627.1 segregation/condensation protein A [Nannocystis poenicansa]
MEQGSTGLGEGAPRARERKGPSSPIYSVELEVFEGPLDLLLHLVRKHELDILDIPISFVAEKYLAYLDVMRQLDLEIAGDYLVMAATLAYLKSRELLPPEPRAGEAGQSEEEEGEDPREALIRRLVEYERFKQAAAELDSLPVSGRDVFARGAELVMPPIDPGLAPVSLFNLAEAYYRVLTRAKVKSTHEVQIEAVTVAQRIKQLALILEEKPHFEFEELFLNRTWNSERELRAMMVVTLMSILEMVKLGVAGVQQPHESPTIRIYRRASAEQTQAALADYDEDASFGAPKPKAGEEGAPPPAREGKPPRTEAELDAVEEAALLAEALASVQEPEEPVVGYADEGEDVAANDPASEYDDEARPAPRVRRAEGRPTRQGRDVLEDRDEEIEDFRDGRLVIVEGTSAEVPREEDGRTRRGRLAEAAAGSSPVADAEQDVPSDSSAGDGSAGEGSAGLPEPAAAGLQADAGVEGDAWAAGASRPVEDEAETADAATREAELADEALSGSAPGGEDVRGDTSKDDEDDALVGVGTAEEAGADGDGPPAAEDLGGDAAEAVEAVERGPSGEDVSGDMSAESFEAGRVDARSDAEEPVAAERGPSEEDVSGDTSAESFEADGIDTGSDADEPIAVERGPSEEDVSGDTPAESFEAGGVDTGSDAEEPVAVEREPSEEDVSGDTSAESADNDGYGSKRRAEATWEVDTASDAVEVTAGPVVDDAVADTSVAGAAAQSEDALGDTSPDGGLDASGAAEEVRAVEGVSVGPADAFDTSSDVPVVMPDSSGEAHEAEVAVEEVPTSEDVPGDLSTEHSEDGGVVASPKPAEAQAVRSWSELDEAEVPVAEEPTSEDVLGDTSVGSVQIDVFASPSTEVARDAETASDVSEPECADAIDDALRGEDVRGDTSEVQGLEDASSSKGQARAESEWASEPDATSDAEPCAEAWRPEDVLEVTSAQVRQDVDVTAREDEADASPRPSEALEELGEASGRGDVHEDTLAESSAPGGGDVWSRAIETTSLSAGVRESAVVPPGTWGVDDQDDGVGGPQGADESQAGAGSDVETSAEGITASGDEERPDAVAGSEEVLEDMQDAAESEEVLEDMQEAAAGSEDVPEDMQEAVAGSEEILGDMQEAAAESEDVPEDMQGAGAGSEDVPEDMQEAAAGSEEIPEDMQEAAARSEEVPEDMQDAAAESGDVPEDMQVADMQEAAKGREEVLEDMREAAAESEDVSEDIQALRRADVDAGAGDAGSGGEPVHSDSDEDAAGGLFLNTGEGLGARELGEVDDDEDDAQ